MKEEITWFLDIKEKTVYDDEGNVITKYWWDGEWVKYDELTEIEKKEARTYLNEVFGL